ALLRGEEQVLAGFGIDGDDQHVNQARGTLGDINVPAMDGIERARVHRDQLVLLILLMSRRRVAWSGGDRTARLLHCASLAFCLTACCSGIVRGTAATVHRWQSLLP